MSALKRMVAGLLLEEPGAPIPYPYTERACSEDAHLLKLLRRVRLKNNDSGDVTVMLRFELNGITVVAAAGEFDLNDAAPMRQALVPLPRTAAADLVMDLHAVTFLDCAVLGVLLDTDGELRRRSGCLRLVDPQSAPRRVMHLLALEDHLCICATLKAALKPIHDGHVGPERATAV